MNWGKKDEAEVPEKVVEPIEEPKKKQKKLEKKNDLSGHPKFAKFKKGEK